MQTFEEYCAACTNDKTFDHVMTVAKKVVTQEAVADFVREKVANGDGGRETYRRIKIVVPETQVKELLKKAYLNQQTIKGLQVKMVPSEENPSVMERAFVFYDDDHPHRFLLDDVFKEEVRSAVRMDESTHVWPTKGQEMQTHLRRIRAPPAEDTTMFLSAFLTREGVQAPQKEMAAMATPTRSRHEVLSTPGPSGGGDTPEMVEAVEVDQWRLPGIVSGQAASQVGAPRSLAGKSLRRLRGKSPAPADLALEGSPTRALSGESPEANDSASQIGVQSSGAPLLGILRSSIWIYK